LISSVDGDGFPNTKALSPPRKREGIKSFWFTTNQMLKAAEDTMCPVWAMIKGNTEVDVKLEIENSN
jgi:hypothetical protein